MTPAEVPEGKVLVNAEDVRLVLDWLMPGEDAPFVPLSKREAASRLRAALPVPEWEPSDELVERYCRTMHGLNSHIAQHNCTSDTITKLRDLHAAGLLRDDL